ncbi:MAG: stage II sporulation protein M [Candidatus Nanohaloarchaea archaeon]
MLPELILREEEQENLKLLVFLGFSSALLGYGLASILFPSKVSFLTIIFAAIPLVYPLTSYFLEDEKEHRPHIPELKVYGSLFLGETLGFGLLGYIHPSSFSSQVSVFQSQLVKMGITGFATNSVSFTGILANNLLVFLGILAVATIIGSAGAFILTWNASVLGVFLSILLKELPKKVSALLFGTEHVPTPLAYVPHAAFEMSGFIVAGITGSLMSAAIYREHFDMETWKDLGKMAAGGVLLIVLGAFLETV